MSPKQVLVDQLNTKYEEQLQDTFHNTKNNLVPSSTIQISHKK